MPPEGLLPIYLDAGTNNETYLRDPFYLGLWQNRPSVGSLYDNNIQGMAGVTRADLTDALKLIGGRPKDQWILFHGRTPPRSASPI